MYVVEGDSLPKTLSNHPRSLETWTKYLCLGSNLIFEDYHQQPDSVKTHIYNDMDLVYKVRDTRLL